MKDILIHLMTKPATSCLFIISIYTTYSIGSMVYWKPLLHIANAHCTSMLLSETAQSQLLSLLGI